MSMRLMNIEPTKTKQSLGERIQRLLDSDCNGNSDACWYLKVMLRLKEFNGSFEDSVANLEENMNTDISYGINILEDEDFDEKNGTTMFFRPRECFGFDCVNVSADAVIAAMEGSAKAIPDWFESDWIHTREMRNGRYVSRKWHEQELENEELGLPF